MRMSGTAASVLPTCLKRFRVVTDGMLAGLGKSLTQAGLDVTILKPDATRNECLELALRDPNMIVFTKCRRRLIDCCCRLPSHRCYLVKSTYQDQQVAEVLDHLSVVPFLTSVGQQSRQDRPGVGGSSLSASSTASSTDGRSEWPRGLKLICDHTMQGLGKALQELNLNVTVLDNNSTMEQCMELALREGRDIITAGSADFLFYSYQAFSGKCHLIKSDVALQQQIIMAKSAIISSDRQDRPGVGGSSLSASSTGSSTDGRSEWPRGLKLICDHTMQGLGKALQGLKLNVAVLDNSGTVEQCMEVARREVRDIITAGSAQYKYYLSQTFSGKCHLIKSHVALQQQIIMAKSSIISSAKVKKNASSVPESPPLLTSTNTTTTGESLPPVATASGESLRSVSTTIVESSHSTVKAVLDCSVLELGATLRAQGWDVLVRGPGASKESSAKKALGQDRYLLTSSEELLQYYKSQLPIGRVKLISTSRSPAEQLQQAVDFLTAATPILVTSDSAETSGDVQIKNSRGPVAVYQLPVPYKFIDNSDQLTDVIQQLKQCQERVVGFDTESEPSFSGCLHPVATLQISTWETAYVLDMLKLSSPQYQDSMAELGRVMFNSDLTVLGFDLRNDVDGLARSFPWLRESLEVCDCMLDLQQFEKRKHTDLLSLSKMVKMYLGVPLSKRHVCSRWNRRPLRESQLVYAALDAYCLLPLWKKLQTEPQYWLDHLKVPRTTLVR